MSFASDIVTDLAQVFLLASEGAVSVSYNGGTAFLAMPGDRGATIQDPEAGPEDMVLVLPLASVTRPTAGDTFTIDSQAWHVRKILAGGPEAGTWEILITRQSRRKI